MLEVCNKFSFEQKVDFPTRLENTLDILLLSDPSKLISIQPAPPIGDHDLVIADFDLCLKKKPRSKHTVFMWHKADNQGLCDYVREQLSLHTFDDKKDIEENWNIFKEILIQSRDIFVPSRITTSRHNLPWYNRTLRQMCNKNQRLYNKARKTK